MKNLHLFKKYLHRRGKFNYVFDKQMSDLMEQNNSIMLEINDLLDHYKMVLINKRL